MNKFKLSALGLMLVCGGLLVGMTAEAAPGAEAGAPATYKTGAQIIFEANTDPVVPVDPIDPSIPVLPIDPIDPEKPIEPGTNGPLSLDYASSFNFGVQKIVSTDQTYYADTQEVIIDGVSSEKPLYAQVTDNRGTLEGWTLEVMQNGQFETASGAELKGAQIVLTDGQHATISESAIPSTVTASDIVLSTTGAKSLLMKAEQGEAAGTHIFRLGDLDTMTEGVQLNVPGKSEKLKDTYTTTLTWVLSTLP